MKQVIVLLIVFCSFSAFAHKTDSIGTKVRNGKTYIIHKVEKGDGLYSISKKYDVGLKVLVDENPGADEVIKIENIKQFCQKKLPVYAVPDQFKIVDEFPRTASEKINRKQLELIISS